MSHGLVPGRAAMGWSVYEAFVLSPTGQAGRLCACTLSWLVPEGKVTSLLGQDTLVFRPSLRPFPRHRLTGSEWSACGGQGPGATAQDQQAVQRVEGGQNRPGCGCDPDLCLSLAHWWFVRARPLPSCRPAPTWHTLRPWTRMGTLASLRSKLLAVVGSGREAADLRRASPLVPRPADPDDSRLVDMHDCERDVRVPGVQPGAPAA